MARKFSLLKSDAIDTLDTWLGFKHKHLDEEAMQKLIQK